MLNNGEATLGNHNHSGNRSSFLGTLKGGLGIMGNISNQDDDNFEMTKNEMVFNQGKILNIENVLNQLNLQKEQQLKEYLSSS